MAWLQSTPRQPGRQTHAACRCSALRQAPCSDPEHSPAALEAQRGRSHAAPRQPGRQVHVPGAVHAPCPEQPVGHTGSEQSCPRHPASHRQSPGPTHAPCPEQLPSPWGPAHTGISHVGPRQPPSHVHEP